MLRETEGTSRKDWETVLLIGARFALVDLEPVRLILFSFFFSSVASVIFSQCRHARGDVGNRRLCSSYIRVCYT